MKINKAIVIGVSMVVCLGFTGCEKNEQIKTNKEASSGCEKNEQVKTNKGASSWASGNGTFEWISPDGVHYWVYRGGYQGIAPRYDSDGNLVIDK